MIEIDRGLRDSERARAAALFWEAFSGKLGRLLGPDARALEFLEAVMQPGFALCARNEAGILLGLAGFKTDRGGLVGGRFADMQEIYGFWGSLWRAPALELFDRPLAPDQLLMDGIFVAAEARGQGVGGALIDAILQEASERGMRQVRLDVVDQNPRARALYERKGFRPRGAVRTGLLGPLMGFQKATTMIAKVR